MLDPQARLKVKPPQGPRSQAARPPGLSATNCDCAIRTQAAPDHWRTRPTRQRVHLAAALLRKGESAGTRLAHRRRLPALRPRRGTAPAVYSQCPALRLLAERHQADAGCDGRRHGTGRDIREIAEQRFMDIEQRVTEMLVLRHELELFLDDVSEQIGADRGRGGGQPIPGAAGASLRPRSRRPAPLIAAETERAARLQPRHGGME